MRMQQLMQQLRIYVEMELTKIVRVLIWHVWFLAAQIIPLATTTQVQLFRTERARMLQLGT